MADLLLTTILISSDLLLMRPIWTMGNFDKDTRYHLEPKAFLPRLVIQLSPNINKARSAPSGIVNITSVQSLLQSSEVSLSLYS